MNLVRRQFLSVAGAGLSSVLAAACVAPAAYAQTDFPNRRIHLVLPYEIESLCAVRGYLHLSPVPGGAPVGRGRIARAIRVRGDRALIDLPGTPSPAAPLRPLPFGER
jgi:hypothetical protein